MINLEKILERKKMTMSIPEFCAYQRGEIKLTDIYFNRQARRSVEKICVNPKIRMMVVLFLVGLITLNQAIQVQAGQLNTGKIDNLGRTVLGLVQSIGYWFCIIMAGKEILTCLMQNQAKDVGGIILKHVMAFGGFYALPWIFDLIKELLS